MQLKRLLLSPAIYLRHGSLRPDAIQLPGTNKRVHLNPDDDRAYKKLVMDSARGRVSTPMRFWREHVQAHPGALCLDVGANYGECFAFADYPNSFCIAVEANPTLLPYLLRTRDGHPDAARIHVESCLVGAEDGIECSLFYSPKWTGGGSAVKAREGLTEARVKGRSLDALLAEQPDWQSSPLIMKMDVEGFEGHVLAGFGELFHRDRAVGILEFDTTMLRRAGTNPRELYEHLASRFHIYLSQAKSRTLDPISAWADLVRRAKDGELHRDLVFCTHPDMLAPGWRVADGAAT